MTSLAAVSAKVEPVRTIDPIKRGLRHFYYLEPLNAAVIVRTIDPIKRGLRLIVSGKRSSNACASENH